MTVKQLIEALDRMPNHDAFVVCEGTSVCVFPRRVAELQQIRAETETMPYGDVVTVEETWAYERLPETYVVILTKETN